MDKLFTDDLLLVLSGKAAVRNPLIDLPVQDGRQFVPVTKKNVTYIVASVIFNENGELLMMQEAKRSCHGLWYLPAGRLEPGESIEEGAQREVLEETGLTFEPRTLLCIEVTDHLWFRFTYTGYITGGKLKTSEEKDEESLQAQWFTVERIKQKDFPIRGRDILRLIDVALSHRTASVRPPDLHTNLSSHHHILIRFVVLHSPADRSGLLLLISYKNKNKTEQLPTICLSDRFSSTRYGLAHLLENVFEPVTPALSNSLRPCGVLSVEYSGKPPTVHDGICLNILVSFHPPSSPQAASRGVVYPQTRTGYKWVNLAEYGDIKKFCEEKLIANQIIPLILL